MCLFREASDTLAQHSLDKRSVVFLLGAHILFAFSIKFIICAQIHVSQRTHKTTRKRRDSEKKSLKKKNRHVFSEVTMTYDEGFAIVLEWNEEASSLYALAERA